MAIYVMLTRLSPGQIKTPSSFEDLERHTVDRIRAECPEVEWLHNLAVLSGYDYLDIFRAPDNATAMKVSAIVRSVGHAHVEVWAAEEWSRFKELVRALPSED